MNTNQREILKAKTIREKGKRMSPGEQLTN
jgi:hypothetical protein